VSRRLAAGALLALAVGGCGGTGSTSSDLAWQGKPAVFVTRGLPHDRVVIARVRNTGKGTLHLIAANLRVRDADGHALKGSAGFTNTYAHGLFGAFQQPAHLPVAELLRLGKIVYLPPGASVPFYAAWHLAPGSKEPVHIDYGPGTLAVPAATGTTH
jgi:hypothetical protein